MARRLLSLSGSSSSSSSSKAYSNQLSAASASQILALRHRSNKANPVQLIEIDLDSSATSSGAGAEVEVVTGGIKKLEEVIQSIIARRAAPDWLPFIPGSSYWVPPRHMAMHSQPHSVVDVIGKLSATAAAANRGASSSDHDAMVFDSLRGWPSSSYFIQGSAPMHLLPAEVEIEMKVLDLSENASKVEDEEG